MSETVFIIEWHHEHGVDLILGKTEPDAYTELLNRLQSNNKLKSRFSIEDVAGFAKTGDYVEAINCFRISSDEWYEIFSMPVLSGVTLKKQKEMVRT